MTDEKVLAEGLNARQISFAHHLAAGKNITQAARDAGYANKGADNCGQRLLRDPRVKALADHLRAIVLSKADISAQQVVRDIYEVHRLAKIDKAYAVAHQCLKTLLDWLSEARSSKDEAPTDHAASANDEAEQRKEALRAGMKLKQALQLRAKTVEH